MSIHGIDEKEFAVLVPIVPPRIGGAGADCFHDFAPWMITPNRAAQGNALFRRRPRHAHLAGTRCAAASIKPAVRAKTQAVGESVMIVQRASEAVENHFRRAVRHTV